MNWFVETRKRERWYIGIVIIIINYFPKWLNIISLDTTIVSIYIDRDLIVSMRW